MIKRIITGIILALVCAAFLVISPYSRLFLITITLLGLSWEINRIVKPSFLSTSFLTLLTVCICAMAWTNHLNHIWLSPAVSLSALLIMSAILFELKIKKIWGQNSSLFFTIRTSLFFLATLPYIFIGVRNPRFAFLIIIALAATDTLAYFVGKKFGKTPLTSLSPKKTVEGSIAGLIATPLSLVLLNPCLKGIALSTTPLFCLGLLISFLAQIGDIHESLLKRLFNQKDSSHLLPGHGGIYDRIDSYIFSIPVVVIILHFWPAS